MQTLELKYKMNCQQRRAIWLRKKAKYEKKTPLKFLVVGLVSLS